MRNPNIEPYLMDRSARICVHRHGWGNKPSLKDDKKIARQSYRRRWSPILHKLRLETMAIDEYLDIIVFPSQVLSWRQFD